MHLDVAISDPRLSAAMHAICRAVADAGGHPLLVGGSVRDAVLGLPVHDLDIEVFQLPPARLRALVGASYAFDVVGRAFPVLKLRGLPVDVTVPCRRSRAADGPASADDLADPDLGVEEAASRRDFTMNAMAWDPSTGELLDPFGGRGDLQAQVLRHASDAFTDDPLRVLRAMQFAARFELSVAPETVALCRGLSPDGLPPERQFEEWKKLVLRGRRPSRGLAFLRACGWTRHVPELEALAGCEQQADWHPEGDVWTHTLHCMDAFAAERIGDSREDLVVGLAVLCHDLGKPATTTREAGRITSKGHELAGEAPTRAFLGRLTSRQDLIDEVVALVLTHLRPWALYDARAGDSAVRRLARQVGRIDRLVRVARADHMGRPPLRLDGFPAGTWLLDRARALEIEAASPRPLVMGRHLLALGLRPGPRVGEILDACYDAQLDGVFSTVESGLELAKKLIAPDPRDV